MTRFRKWLLLAGIVLALLLPLGSVASADPGTHGGRPTTYAGAALDPGDSGSGP